MGTLTHQDCSCFSRSKRACGRNVAEFILINYNNLISCIKIDRLIDRFKFHNNWVAINKKYGKKIFILEYLQS